MKLRSVLLGCLLAIATMAPAQASLVVYHATLNGANESPPTGSSGTGDARVTFDNVLNTLLIELTFAGLTTPASAGHIHCCTPPGTNTIVAVPFVGLPATVSGTYVNTIDLTLLASYNGQFITDHGGTVGSAEAALIAGIGSGLTYVNLHNATFPGGEIRGFLTQVPEPETLALLLAGIGAFSVMHRRRKA